MNIKKSQNVSRDVPVFVTPEMKAKGVFNLVHPNVQRDIPVVVTQEMQAAGVSAYPSGNNVQPVPGQFYPNRGQPYQVSTLPKEKYLPRWYDDGTGVNGAYKDEAVQKAYEEAGGKFPAGAFDIEWMSKNKTNMINRINNFKVPPQVKKQIINHIDYIINYRKDIQKRTETSNNMLEKLIKMANLLDDIGYNVESDELTKIAIKLAKKKKNVPNNPSLWASCKAWAKSTFDVYPSAYSNGAAAKRYKSKGGTWRKSE